MSKNKHKAKGKNSGKVLPWVVCVLLIVVVVVLAVLIRNASAAQDLQDDTGGTENTDTAVSVPVVTMKDESLAYNLGSGICIDGLLSYAGPYAEDKTDEVVVDVMAIKVTNNGSEYIQTMDIILTDGTTEARFSLSTLMPGDTVIVPERNRMSYSDEFEFSEAKTENVAFFGFVPPMCEDKLEIVCLDGVINVTNISGEDITEDIFVYYKTESDGIFYGGVTYRVRISGGLKADEIRQGAASHFNTESSAVVFVTCG